MAVDRIDDDRDLDIQVMLLPSLPDQKYHLQLTEKELMEAIGRTATALFTLLNQTQPKMSPMMGVVVIKEKVEAPCLEQEVEEVALNVIAPETVDDIIDPPALVIEEEKVPVEVTEEIAPPVQEVEEEEKILIPPPAPKFDAEPTEKMIESYRQQIRLMTQAATQERQLLKTQEQIQILQQGNRNSLSNPFMDDPKVDLLKRIAHFEREIQVAQQKIVELQQTLKDNQGT